MPEAGSPRPDDQPDARTAGPASGGPGGAPSGAVPPPVTASAAEPAAPAVPDEPGTDSTVRDWPTAPAAPVRADDGAPADVEWGASGDTLDDRGLPDGRRPADDDDAGSGRPVGRPVLALLGVLALLAVAGTAWLAWQVRQQARTDTARTEAVIAAREAAQLLFSYDHERLEQDFQAGLAVTTGGFRQEYERTTREEVTPVATRDDAVVTAEVVEAGVAAASPDRVTVVVYVDQTTTSNGRQGPELERSRLRMTLREVDGDWLVERVEAL